MAMRSTILTETRHFLLHSYGNGTAYALEHRALKQSVFVQGDDAVTLRDEYDKLSSGRLRLSNDEVLAVLWQDYCTVAQDVVPEVPAKRAKLRGVG